MEQLVTLEQMLAARDTRRERIMASLDRAPLVSFTMNIAGPMKNSPLIRRSFWEGRDMLAKAFSAHGISFSFLNITDSSTGCEALLAAEGSTSDIKRICTAIEDSCALGRLFDMDVIAGNGKNLDRSDLGLPERSCMVCGAPGRGCAARRIHTVDELRAETERRLTEHFLTVDRRTIENLATDCLITEVRVTPKPGLVDRANTGSHTDMDLALFEKSAAALTSFWGECFGIGAETAALEPEETFFRLRKAGLAAEKTMLTATGGVNTHKGAIFLLGTVCGAIGRLWDAAEPCRDAHAISRECSRMTTAPLNEEFSRILAQGAADTAGAGLYLHRGIRGARGELADGLPGMRETALPAIKRALAQGCDEEHAAAVALLHLIARGTDTNMIKRGGEDGAVWGTEAAAQLLRTAQFPTREQISALDEAFIARNLSPGGCADLLAVTLFLHRWEKMPEAPI